MLIAAWGKQGQTSSAWMSPAGQGRERGVCPSQRVRSSAADTHLRGKLWSCLPYAAAFAGVCPRELLQVSLSHSYGLVVILWCSSPVGVVLQGEDCWDNVSHVVGLNKGWDLRISHPEASLLLLCQGVLTSVASTEDPSCSPMASPSAQCSTGPSTVRAGRGPSSLLSTPAFCLLSNGVSHAPGRLGLYFRI